MEVRLDSKIVLITGASQGIGEAVASLAAMDGAPPFPGAGIQLPPHGLIFRKCSMWT